MSIRPKFKHGIARLTAAAEGNGRKVAASSLLQQQQQQHQQHNQPQQQPSTRLTQVSHKAPMRLVPVWKSSVAQAGAAVCTLSNYGGGMLQGDSVELHVHVKEQARLGVTTQGASRIYTQRIPNTCQATLDCHVGAKGLLVWAPDPCALFQASSFEQTQEFTIHPTSSVALIDWFSSGRYRNGEHWAFDHLSSRTALTFAKDDDDDDDDDDNDAASDTRAVPFLQDAVHLDLRGSTTTTTTTGHRTDPLGVTEFHAFASLILYGDQVQAVQRQCQTLSDALLAHHTRIRQRSPVEEGEVDEVPSTSSISSISSMDLSMLGLSGRVCMGTSQVEVPQPTTTSGDSDSDSDDSDSDSDDDRETSQARSQAHVVRFAATTNEDLYRIFHHCLLPLQPKFGMEFYKDRIRAKASEIPTLASTVAATTATTIPTATEHELEPVSIRSIHKPAKMTTTTTTAADADVDVDADIDADAAPHDDAAIWSAYMLADSALPTGSFAHSAGLEVASQIGMIQSQQEMETFVNAATRSALQTTAPFLEAGHAFARRYSNSAEATNKDGFEDQREAMLAEWNRLHRQAQAVMAPNALACAASLDQGKSLARVAKQWLSDTNPEDRLLLDCFDQGYHVGPVLGALASRLDLPPSQLGPLFGYCVARDMVSAAVRLSLVGPLASVKSLRLAHEVVRDGWAAYERRRRVMAAATGSTETAIDPMALAAASAPVIEALHPCHEALQIRLFRS